MNTTKRLLVASLVLGVISFVCFVLERLAMTDIFHGESDLSLEWSVVSASFLPILLFHGLSVVAAVVAIRTISGSGGERRAPDHGTSEQA